MVDSVKGKELLMHKYKKHLRICPNSMINNMELFLFTVVFLQLFALFLFLFFPPPFLSIPFRVIYYGFCTISPIHVWVRCWEFLCSLSPLLEPFTLNCKAACLLFFQYATLKDWEGSLSPRTEVQRWSLSSDTVKSSINIFYLFL